MTQWKHLVGILLVLLLLCIAASAIDDGPEVYVVAADYNGYSNYLKSLGNGQFDPQMNFGGPPLEPYSYGNGIGDFDNDGDFDYVIGDGNSQIYLYEKKGPGLDFESPIKVGTWSMGDRPTDMAVADFNNDGKMDFVMMHSNSQNSELYLGDGHGAFTYQVLENTGPGDSFGADAADVNNDGHVDFVVAPSYYSSLNKIYVNLGDGDGTFTTSSFDTSGMQNYYGLTAADFDNDNKVDLIATGLGGYDYYTGNGAGTFTFTVAKSVTDPKIYYSPIDNYDFNDDRKQDFVISRLGGDANAVAVYLGKGTGTFTYSATYTGGSGSDRVAISAPPYIQYPIAVIIPAHQEVPQGIPVSFDASDSYYLAGTTVNYKWTFGDGDSANGIEVIHSYTATGLYKVILTVTDNTGRKSSAKADVLVTPVTNNPPIALVTPATQSIIAGSTASFDGSASLDPDGTITAYEWNFGDGTTKTGSAIVSHAYNSAGSYTAILTVTDDDGQTATADTEVVVTAIPATVDIEPKTLNLKSQGQNISATIVLPAGYDVSQIDMNTVALRYGNIPIRFALNNPKYGFVANIEAGTAGRGLLRVKFDRQAVIDAVVQPSDPTVLWLSGKVNVNGVSADFSGSASIRTIMPGNSNSNTAKTKK